jgi:hypothetical protein
MIVWRIIVGFCGGILLGLVMKWSSIGIAGVSTEAGDGFLMLTLLTFFIAVAMKLRWVIIVLGLLAFPIGVIGGAPALTGAGAVSAIAVAIGKGLRYATRDRSEELIFR